MDDEWKASFDEIKSKYELAFQTIEVGEKYEAAANAELAIVNYKIGIEFIDKALATPVALPDDTDSLDDSWSVALQMIQKLKRTRGELLRRIVLLTPSSSVSVKYDATKSVNESEQTEPKLRPRTFMELAEALQNFEIESNELPSILEILLLCENVKLYRIKASGEVTTTDESSTLRIIRLDQDLTRNVEATYFMQIIRSSAAQQIEEKMEEDSGNDDVENQIDDSNRKSPPKENEPKNDASIFYPLIPSVTPIIRTEFGAFIFPDLESDEEGAAFGLVIPSALEELVLEIFDAVLHGIIRQGEAEEEPEEEEGEESEAKRARRTRSDAISENIVKGACFVSNGLVKGSEQLGRFVTFSTPYLLSKLSRAPENRPPVSDKVRNSVEIAKTATGLAASATGFVAGKVGAATIALGRFLAPHVHAQGTRLLTHTIGVNQDEAEGRMSGILTVAAGAVEGFGTVYTGLENSAAILGKNLSENSVKVIQHKYGPSAGNVAAETFDTVGNMINLSRNVGYITPKGLAKKTVKGTGQAIFTDFAPKRKNYVPAAALYPDLTEFSIKLAQPKV